MTPDEARAAVEGHVAVIGQALYEGVAGGLAEAEARLEGFNNLSSYPALTPMLARYAMRNHWAQNGIGPGWALGGNPGLMGQTLLTHSEFNLQMRLLKERSRTYPGGTPVAGRNHARRGYWIADPLGFPVVGASVQDLTRLLLLWDRRVEDGHSIVTVRVVHPTGAGVYGSAVPIDMSYTIRPDGGIFDQLRYDPTEPDEDFFPDIQRDDNEGTTDGS